MNYKELTEIYNRANRIVASDLEWDAKYDLIFSVEVSVKLFDLFEWCAPDTTYEEDVRAFMVALEEYYNGKAKIISEQIDIDK